ncbi:hypothetical protein JWG41_10060 [Leptospira sp. 201903075]|uniref:hypothetical protein n=1 Tax=Leptospira chreensis TaxID=2810035 RepID=UPI001964B85E|nr:hypothetical protein [Leptospira chreensis]MBM9590789.1 hypothetical protein [Leptospira chreensis]
MEFEALNPNLYAQVLDELELIPSTKPYQILFYGSRERGDFHEESDLNFYLVAHSTDQMKSQFIDSISRALQKLEDVAPVNMIAGDADSLRHRLKISEPGSLQLMEASSVFFGEGIIDDLRTDWDKWKQREIPKSDLIQYLEKRIRFFKQQVTRNTKDEISQLERITTLTLHIWALQNIHDLTHVELLKMDTPDQMAPLFTNLYRKEMEDSVWELLELQTRVRKLKVDIRWKREVSREDIHETKYKLISLRNDEEFMMNLWA